MGAMGISIDLIRALTPLAWPVIAVLLFLFILPQLKKVISSRAFTIKVGNMEITVQEATEQIRLQIEDLQKQVVTLRAILPPTDREPTKSNRAEPMLAQAKRILWVDDKPSNNALEIAQIQDAGIDVIQVKSTEEAIQIMNETRSIAAVISDMGRRESNEYRAQAGIILLRALRRAGYETPYYVYSSRRYAERNNVEVKEAGGDGATASPVDLLEWVGRVTARNSK